MNNGRLFTLQLQPPVAEAQGKVGSQQPGCLEAQDLVQVIPVETAVKVSNFFGSYGKFGIVGWDIYLPYKQISPGNSGDTGQPKFFNKPVLQGLKQPFYSALGLRGTGMDEPDVQFCQSSGVLGSPLIIQTEIHLVNATPVKVEREGPAAGFQVVPGSSHKAVGGFTRRELQPQDPAGGIVNES